MLALAVLFSVLFTTTLAGPCQSGWEKFGGSCYFGYIHLMYTYEEAKTVCEGMNSTLAIIDNAEENLFLKGYTQNRFHIWFGLNDNDTEGNYVWEDGSPLSYSNWNQGQPDNHDNNEHCIHFVSNSDGRWNDLPCSRRLGFICERSARQ